jgi:hypothetical protein
VNTNILQVTYKPDARFQPQGLRDAVAQVEAKIVLLQIVASGRIEKQGSTSYFVAGKDRFLLTNPESAPAGPAGELLSITGTVDDPASPYKLKLIESKKITP